MSKFQIDLNKYPNLKNLFNDKEQFAELLRGTVEDLDRRVGDGHTKIARDVFQRDYATFNKQVMDAFFDYRAIAEKHHNEAEANSMKVLQHDLNPLSLFTSDAQAYDAAGNPIAPEEFTGMKEFDVTDFLRTLLYGARFVHIKQLAEYLQLDQYELIDVMRARNIKQLLPVQPALEHQESEGITVGKMIPDIGVFDCGVLEEEDEHNCIACGQDGLLHGNDGQAYAYCPNCRAGYLK